MSKPTAETLQTLNYDALDRIQQIRIGSGTDLQRFYRHSELVSQKMTGTTVSYLREANSLLAMVKNNAVQMTGTDQQGSIVLTDEGTQAPSFSYTAHGFNPAPDLLGYCGEATDPITGCYLLGNGYRAYDPTTMRFRSPDSFSPFGAGGINPYAYCGADPINRSDPTGHFDWIRWTGIGFTVVSFAVGLYFAKGSLPTFAKLTAKMTGGGLGARLGATATNASAAAAVSVSLTALSTGAQIASTIMFAFADGDESTILNARILGLVSGVLGLAALGAAIGEAKMTPKENGPLLTRYGQRVFSDRSTNTLSLPSSVRPLSYSSVPPSPVLPHLARPHSPLPLPELPSASVAAAQALGMRTSAPDSPKHATELREVGISSWNRPRYADITETQV